MDAFTRSSKITCLIYGCNISLLVDYTYVVRLCVAIVFGVAWPGGMSVSALLIKTFCIF